MHLADVAKYISSFEVYAKQVSELKQYACAKREPRLHPLTHSFQAHTGLYTQTSRVNNLNQTFPPSPPHPIKFASNIFICYYNTTSFSVSFYVFFRHPLGYYQKSIHYSQTYFPANCFFLVVH